MRFRLIVSDLDGTIYQRGRGVSDRTKATIQRVIEAGLLFTLASGRMPRILLPIAEQLGTNAPLICYGGALVYEPVAQRDLYQRGVPLPLTFEVIREARRRKLAVNVYKRDELLIERLEESSPAYENWRRNGARAVGDLERFVDFEPHHLAIVCPESLTRSLTEELRTQFAGLANVTSGPPLLVEFSHPQVNKGTALAWLARHLQLEPSQVLAIGDDLNDVEMLRWAGYAVVMSSAPAEALAVADEVAPAGEDAVAEVIERLCLKV